jgi:5'-nucleotidase
MSDENNIALIDMDGTIADFDGQMQRDYRTALRLELPGSYHLPIEAEHNVKDLIKRQPGWWRKLPRIDLGIYLACRLEAMGFRLMVLTKGPVRTTTAWTEKVEWCQENLPTADVTITHDKSLVYGKVLVDDWPEYITPWLVHRPRGLVLMPDRPWNQDFVHPRVRRYASHQDVAALEPELLGVLAR